MMKILRADLLIWFFLLTLITAGSACRAGQTEAQKTTRSETVQTNPTPTATPYQPPKRVSRDVIKTDEKNEPPKTRTR